MAFALKSVVGDVTQCHVLGRGEHVMSGTPATRTPGIYPDWDSVRESPSMTLASACRYLSEVDRDLRSRREQWRRKRAEMEEKWADVRRKEEMVRGSMTAFNKFVMDNVEKRERARRAIAEHRAYRRRRLEHVQRLRDRVEALQTIEDEMRQRVDVQYCMYGRFMEQVSARSSNRFDSAHHVIVRYETLDDARVELASRQRRYIDELESMRSEWMAMCDSKSHHMAVVYADLSSILARRDAATTRAIMWETEVNRIKKTIADAHVRFHRLKACARGLYADMCALAADEGGVHGDDVHRDDVEGQLAYIKRRIVDMAKVADIVRRRAAGIDARPVTSQTTLDGKASVATCAL